MLFWNFQPEVHVLQIHVLQIQSNPIYILQYAM